MKIIKSQIFMVEMSFEELIAIKKLVGRVPGRVMRSNFGMTQEQVEAAHGIYDCIDESLGDIYDEGKVEEK